MYKYWSNDPIAKLSDPADRLRILPNKSGGYIVI